MEDQGEVVPADLGQLAPQALLDDGQLKAIVVMARSYPTPQSGEESLRAFASACGSPEAFSWFWALMMEAGTTEHRWTIAAQSLAPRLSVPPSLEEDVRAFVVEGEGKEGPQGEAGRQLILERVEPSLAQRLARELAENEDAPPTGALETATLKVLSESLQPIDRQAALLRIKAMPAPNRFEALGYLTVPYKKGEQAEIAELVRESLTDGLTGHGAPIMQFAANVLRTFHPKTAAEVLADERWPGNARDQVLRRGVITHLDALLTLNEGGADSAGAFGKKTDVDQVRHLLGTAAGWGGLPESEAFYSVDTEPRKAGRYRMTLEDVPVDGFWSVTIYNRDGFLEENPYDSYSLNIVTAVAANGDAQPVPGRRGAQEPSVRIRRLELRAAPLSAPIRDIQRNLDTSDTRNSRLKEGHGGQARRADDLMTPRG